MIEARSPRVWRRMQRVLGARTPAGPLSTALFVWSAVVLGAAAASGQPGPSAVAWEEKIEVASGDAYQGPWRMNESRFLYVDDPTVAINQEGIVAVAWAEQARKDIFLQIYEPDGQRRLEKPVNVSGSPQIFSWLPRMIITSGDASEVSILWQEIVFSGGSHGGEILFARSSDGGRTFGDPINLSSSIAGDGKGRLTPRYWHNGSLDLAKAPSGDLYAAWTEYEGTLWFSRSTDRGATFFDPLRIAGGDAAKPARGPSLAVGAEGAVHLAWTVGEDPAADIHIARSADRGHSFGKPRVVLETDGHADAPSIAADGKGTLHLAHAESPAGPFERYHIRYARSSDGGATFEEPREISSPQAGPFESASFPTLDLDGEGNPYVVWELFPNRKHRPLGLGFSRSNDGGRTFAPPSIVPGTLDPALGFNGSLQGLLMRKLAVSEAGAVTVVNSTFKRNETSHVWLFRGQAAGR